MSRHIYELIDLLMQMEENLSRMYNNIACLDGSSTPQVSTAAKVLSRQEANHAQNYRDMLSSIDLANIQISEVIYDKTMVILKSFKQKIKMERMNDTQELLEYAVEFERENAKVISDVLLFLDEEESEFKILLSTLIKAEEEHIKMLSTFIK